MFIRIKKIKNNEYAYLVENKWKQGKSKQKVKAYLGRVLDFEEKEFDFNEDLSNASFVESVAALISWQAKRYGGKRSDNILKINDINIDLKKKTVIKGKNPVAIRSHDGFICNKTLKDLFNFKVKGDEQEIGYALARAFVDAGINVPKESFIQIFEKVMSNES